MNKILRALQSLVLSDIQSYKAEGREQVSAKLPSGEQIHVMQSKCGWHVAFGSLSPYSASEAVDEDTAAQIIRNA